VTYLISLKNKLRNSENFKKRGDDMEQAKEVNVISVKLAHYFVKERNYKPIVVRNSINDLWLENFHEQYKIIRIVLHPIINDVQLQTDLNFAFRVKKSIEKNTFSYRTKMLNIYLNLNTGIVNKYKQIDAIKVDGNKDFDQKQFANFRDISNVDINYNNEDEMKKLSQEIQVHSNHEFSKIHKKVSSKNTPFVTYSLLAICITIFVMVNFLGVGYLEMNTFFTKWAMHKGYVLEGQLYRMITSSFLHADLMHVAFNMYALYMLGKITEGVLGSLKYFTVYFMSVLMGSLLSLVFVGPDVWHVGASGGLFGVMGGLVYFGLNNRSVFGGLLRNSLIPLLAFNLMISVLVPSISLFGHLGGLIGGFFTTMALGTLNDDKSLRLQGKIATIVLYSAVIYMIFFI
jgi:rhomboid protease GluP